MGWEAAGWETIWPVSIKDQCSQPDHRELPSEEVASVTAGERVSAVSWLHKVSPRRS